MTGGRRVRPLLRVGLDVPNPSADTRARSLIREGARPSVTH